MKYLRLISPVIGAFLGGMTGALLNSMGLVFVGVILGFFLPWILIYMPEVRK